MSNQSLLRTARGTISYGSIGEKIQTEKTNSSQQTTSLSSEADPQKNGSFFGEVLEWVFSSEKNNILQHAPERFVDVLQSPEVSISEVKREEGTCLLPIHWDRPSIEEAQEHYVQQYQSTTDSLLAERYNKLATLLARHLKSQDSLNKATQENRGDEIEIYRTAFFHFRYAAEALQKEFTPESIRDAELHQKIAAHFFNAATCIGEAIELAKPNFLTGELNITTRDIASTKSSYEYHLSQFSFKEPGSINSYYSIITIPTIISGSNLKTINTQKILIERASAHLAKAHAKKFQLTTMGKAIFPILNFVT